MPLRKSSRRQFIQNAATLVAIAAAGSAFHLKKYNPKLSFSTIGCPDWDFKKIVLFAKENNYEGIEIRGIQRQLDLLKCNEFNTPENIIETRKFVEDNGIKIVNLGASASLHSKNQAERKRNIEDAKQFIDLAEQLKCPYIRVFPNDFPADQERNETIDLIAKGLLELGDYAKGSHVTVLLESHGKVIKIEDLETIMKAAEHPHVGLIWDIVNMWSITKESPAEAYSKLKKYVKHTHIKDLNMVNGKEKYTLLGKGESPIFEAIDLLINGGYKGYLSFEWEKLWHPELAEPELALADYPKAIRQHLQTTG